MSLVLDTRQRAMLQEMGVRIWQPMPGVEPADPSLAPVAVAKDTSIAIQDRALEAINARPQLSPTPRRASGQRPSEVHVEASLDAAAVVMLDWPTLAQAAATCRACALCAGRSRAVLDATLAPKQADWLVLGEVPDEAEERAGHAFADSAGVLLDNMLKAVRASRHGAQRQGRAAAYVSNAVKCRPAQPRNPTAQELLTCGMYLAREVALVQPKVILGLGRLAAQALLASSQPELGSLPLGRLRGTVYSYQGIPVVLSYHPSTLLRNPADKARAWADLCLAQSLLSSAT